MFFSPLVAFTATIQSPRFTITLVDVVRRSLSKSSIPSKTKLKRTKEVRARPFETFLTFNFHPLSLPFSPNLSTPRLLEMDETDYWSIESILADNQVSLRSRSVLGWANREEKEGDERAELTLVLPSSLPSRLVFLQKLPCTFLLDAEGLGYLDGAGEADVSGSILLRRDRRSGLDREGRRGRDAKENRDGRSLPAGSGRLRAGILDAGAGSVISAVSGVGWWSRRASW